MSHTTPIYLFQLAPRRPLVDRLDSRMLADIGIDHFGNPLERNDPQFRSRRTPVLFARLIDSIVAWTSRRIDITGLSSLGEPLQPGDER